MLPSNAGKQLQLEDPISKEKPGVGKQRNIRNENGKFHNHGKVYPT